MAAASIHSPYKLKPMVVELMESTPEAHTLKKKPETSDVIVEKALLKQEQ